MFSSKFTTYVNPVSFRPHKPRTIPLYPWLGVWCSWWNFERPECNIQQQRCIVAHVQIRRNLIIASNVRGYLKIENQIREQPGLQYYSFAILQSLLISAWWKNLNYLFSHNSGKITKNPYSITRRNILKREFLLSFLNPTITLRSVLALGWYNLPIIDNQIITRLYVPEYFCSVFKIESWKIGFIPSANGIPANWHDQNIFIMVVRRRNQHVKFIHIGLFRCHHR